MSNDPFQSNSIQNHLTPTKAVQKDSDDLLETNAEDQNENDTIDNQEDNQIPPTSRWHFLITSRIPVWKFDDQKIIRINLSREKFFPYYFCHILISIVYIYYYQVLSKYITSNRIIFTIITISFVLTHICYLMAHFTSPGILPWNWAKTKQRIYSKNELRDGIAINHEQKEWGKNHDWPARSFFSGDFGAIILRAEHYCPWISQWVGLKNLKFFLQSLFYSAVFSIEILYVLYLVFFNSDAKDVRKSVFFIFTLISSCYFLFHFTLNFTVTIYRASKNYTMVESLFYYDLSYYNKGIRKNLEEVFGSIYLFPLWLLPVYIPLPKDGMDYVYRPNAVSLAKNRGDDYKEHKR